MSATMSRAFVNSDGTVLDSIQSHDNNYNLIRLILAASVILFHASYIDGKNGQDFISRLIWPATDLGGLAVQCFFFLSGLFVSQSIFKDASLIDFAVKRFMRVFPGLFACTLISVIVLAFASLGFDFWRVLFIPETYSYILGSGSLIHLQWSIPSVLSDNPSHTINGSIHTLPSEIKMYVMLGLLTFAGATSSKKVFGFSVTGLLVLLTAVGKSAVAMWVAPTDAYAMIFMFVAGMAVCASADKLKINLAQGFVLSVAYFFSRHTPLLDSITLYVLAIWLMLYFGQSSTVRKFLHPRTDPSYGIYIYGWPSEQLVKVIAPSIGSTKLALFAMPLALGVALISWYYVEKPCMNLAKRFVQWRCSKEQIRSIFPALQQTGAVSFICLAFLAISCVGMALFTSHVNVLPSRKMAVEIIDYGPHESSEKKGFNVQPDGGSALWLTLSAPPPQDVSVVFEGQRLVTTSSTRSRTVTAAVPKSLIHVGEKHIYLQAFAHNESEESNVVVMDIK